MSLPSAPLQKLSVTQAGDLEIDGGLIAVGGTLDPGGLDVGNVSTFRDNLTVEGTLFVPGGVSGLAAVATSGSASDLGTGTLPIERVADGAVTLAKLADLATARVIGRNTAGTGVPESVTMPQLQTLLATAGGWVTDTVAGSAVQDLATSLSMSGADQDYEIEGTILTPNATRTYTAEPNSLATNQTSAWVGRDTSALYSSTSTTLYIAGVTATSTINFRIRISQRTGQERQFTVYAVYSSGAGGHTVHGRWTVTTEITGFRIHGSAASSIAIGSTIRARRI